MRVDNILFSFAVAAVWFSFSAYATSDVVYPTNLPKYNATISIRHRLSSPSANPYSFDASPSDIGREWGRIYTSDILPSTPPSSHDAASTATFSFPLRELPSSASSLLSSPLSPPLPPPTYLPSAELHSPPPPGTLLLNMLIKNERDHLDRTLPLWAKIIDCWVIGVDDANTDDSAEVILRHLGHIPGAIVTVHFDGMGPTWSLLASHGAIHYSQCTHGIISDADFAPIPSSFTFDKTQLDVRCSKHMFTITSKDRDTERKMDWIYRNVPGVHIERRTHQILRAPPLLDQRVMQTLVDLVIEERPGGYQDRTPGKMERYIGFLKKDLEEIPGDPRSLYYVAYGYFDWFLDYFRLHRREEEDDTGLVNSGVTNARLSIMKDKLGQAIDYFLVRASVFHRGNREERYFAMIKLGEIFERYGSYVEPKYFSTSSMLSSDPKPVDTFVIALYWYMRAARLDSMRGDAFFYAGQFIRSKGFIAASLPWMLRSASLRFPLRSMFNWEGLYQYVAKMELARTLAMLSSNDASKEVFHEKVSGGRLSTLSPLVLFKIVHKVPTGQGTEDVFDYHPSRSLFTPFYHCQSTLEAEMGTSKNRDIQELDHNSQDYSLLDPVHCRRDSSGKIELVDVLASSFFPANKNNTNIIDKNAYILTPELLLTSLSLLRQARVHPDSPEYALLRHLINTIEETLLPDVKLRDSISVSTLTARPIALSVKALTAQRMKPIASLLRLLFTLDSDDVSKSLYESPSFQQQAPLTSAEIQHIHSDPRLSARLPALEQDNTQLDFSYHALLQFYLDDLRQYREDYTTKKQQYTAMKKNVNGGSKPPPMPIPPHIQFLRNCSGYKNATGGYISFIQQHFATFSPFLLKEGVLNSELLRQWTDLNVQITEACEK